jgi:predicted aldo/keto reductase-like oxidoreductase
MLIWFIENMVTGNSDCGRCEKKCPEKLEMRKQLKRVEDILTTI